MNLDSEHYPFLYFRGQVTTFKRSEQTSKSYFGGPGKASVQGIQYGPQPLHHIATISTAHLGLSDSKFGDTIPFYYGMCFGGCELTYKLPVYTMAVACAPTIKITKLHPTESSKAWPYEDYPRLLPYLPLEIKKRITMPLQTFSNSVMQGIDDLSDDELILVVPPNPMMGVTLWGPDGDAEEVQIIFRYNSKTGTLVAQNACT